MKIDTNLFSLRQFCIRWIIVIVVILGGFYGISQLDNSFYRVRCSIAGKENIIRFGSIGVLDSVVSPFYVVNNDGHYIMFKNHLGYCVKVFESSDDISIISVDYIKNGKVVTLKNK